MAAALPRPSPSSVWTWLSITFLWGTVFYSTSTWMLKVSSVMLNQGAFNPTSGQVMTVYGIFLLVLAIVALLSMTITNRLDPGALKRRQRQEQVAEGRSERYFVSLLGGIVTSFTFSILTALTYVLTVPLSGAVVALTPATVLTASALNIAAGLGVSLLVGMIIFLGRTLTGKK